MPSQIDLTPNDLAPYQVHARREIVTLLKSIAEHHQLLRMTFANGSESIVTSILLVDEASDCLVIDGSQSQSRNQQVIDSDTLSFETALEHIRILFFSTQIDACEYDGLPAFMMPIPPNVIRLQRRESYRVATPISNPARCTIQIPNASGKATVVSAPLKNVSGGGIAIVDENKALDDTCGHIYKDCRIDLPGGTLVVATLEIRNSQEITLTNGKSVRRIGCLFVDLPQSMLAAVQRYITKLEREQNARVNGMG